MSPRIAHSQTFTNVADIEDHAFNPPRVFTVYLNLSQKLELHAKYIDILIRVSQHHCSPVGRLLY
jgi:beta-galactosidase beta subunit